jgi:capsid protein
MDHARLRIQGREKFHDSIQARALVERYADTVVDIGLKLEPAPMAQILGIEQEFAERWAKDIAERHHLWAMSRGSYRSEIMNFYQAQRLAEVYQQRDNDYFVRLFYNRRADLLSPLQIQFIDPDQIVGDGFTVTRGLQFTKDGIVRDAAGREIGYKIQTITKTGEYKTETVPAIGPRSKRRHMLHGFQPEYAGQSRGYSLLSHTLQEFENLTDFTSAQIKKAINQSNLTMFVQPSKDAVASNPWETLLRRPAGPAARTIGATPTTPPEGETPVPIEEVLNYLPLPEAMNRVPGSVALANLQEGEKIVPFESTAPAESFDKFVDHFTAHLSASRSMPIEVLLMKFGTNYSASRGALILFWRIAQIWRHELQSDFLNLVYEMWLSEEIAAGRVSAPGWSDPRLRAAWTNANWWGAPMPIIDPVKAMRSDKGWAEMGAHDLDTVARNLNGSDGAMNRSKLARQYQTLEIAPWTQKSEG